MINQTSFVKRFFLPSVMFFGYTSLLWAILAYIPIYFTDIGFSHFEISTLLSIFPLVSLVLMVPLGIFSDRLSPKKLVTISLVLFAIFLAGLRQTGELWSLTLLFVIGGIGDSLFRISNMSLFYKTLGDTNKGKKLGFFMGSGLLGYGMGPLLGGYVLTSFDMSFLLWVTLLILAPFFILGFFLQDVEPIKFNLGDYRRDIANKEVLILVILSFLVSLHLGVERTSLSLFLSENISLSEDSIGMMFFFIGITIAILSVINGVIGDRRTGKGKSLGVLFYSGIFISGLFNMSLFYANSFGTVLAMRLLHIIGDSLLMVSRNTIISNLFLPERIGGNLGIITTTITLGTFVGAVASGIIPGYVLPFIIAGVLAILAIPPAIAARPKF